MCRAFILFREGLVPIQKVDINGDPLINSDGSVKMRWVDSHEEVALSYSRLFNNTDSTSILITMGTADLCNRKIRKWHDYRCVADYKLYRNSHRVPQNKEHPEAPKMDDTRTFVDTSALREALSSIEDMVNFINAHIEHINNECGQNYATRDISLPSQWNAKKLRELDMRDIHVPVDAPVIQSSIPNISNDAKKMLGILHVVGHVVLYVNPNGSSMFIDIHSIRDALEELFSKGLVTRKDNIYRLR